MPVLAFLIILAIIWKMPEDKIFEFGIATLEGFKNLSLFGWALAIIVCILWAGHARSLRRKHSAEYFRIGTEKSKLQQDRINMNLGSSDSY